MRYGRTMLVLPFLALTARYFLKPRFQPCRRHGHYQSQYAADSQWLLLSDGGDERRARHRFDAAVDKS